MIILATEDGLNVTDKDIYNDLHIEVDGLSHDAFVDVVASSVDLAPHDAPRHVWVRVDMLRRELDTEALPERRSGLEAMVKYAASKGWLNEAGTHVSAHVLVP